MTAALRDWLLTCPEVKWISAVALEAAEAGLFDLHSEMAKAISGGVRMASLGESLRVQPRAYYQRSARMLAHRRKGCSLSLVSDTLVLTGSIFQGVAISESRDSTVLYVRQAVPEIAAMALVGRNLDDLIRIGRFEFSGYRITEAERDEWGLAVWFDVPRLAFKHFI
ncbi:hypothetical protein [Sphingomonas sp. PP-CC-3A-396]|uniref:hypothetical protein n=1 Tax=Sphingomonas sp. PP-CC-3A-396 TaxID=2135655 RepID=UPI0010529373|nr:hypothetical protein [Sphingomonas sp. PP-CC-3A-396]TCQ06314.1 hypothetical protein C8J40_105102 [Sphingomonas sp. PP-CC-3A-396]